MLVLDVYDDDLAELAEHFEVVLLSAQSADGVNGTTVFSGASILASANTNNITIPESDYPYGLLQFTTTDTVLLPATQQPQVRS